MTYGTRQWWMIGAIIACLAVLWGSSNMISQGKYATLDGLVPPDARNVTYEYNGLTKGSMRYEPSSEHAGFDDILTRIGWQHTWQTEDRLIYNVPIRTQPGNEPLETITILTRQRFGVLTEYLELYYFYGAHLSVAIYVQRCLHIYQWEWCG